ncbi:MAG: hypothetical protein JNM93_05840 [Bacteriovoracaceae bacterium]|nr:hypothetical protein [Bacteriovoracaceae bacterium]
MKKILCLIIILPSLIACNKNDDRLKEKTTLESEYATTSQLRVENENLADKAEKMEQDLTKRHRFYKAIKGSYEGDISTNQGTFNIRITLTPSLAPIPVNRTRQLEEIVSDLNNLSLNAQVIQWDPNNTNSAVGCRMSGIRPDIIKGELAISTESCPNLYLIKITERGFFSSATENAEVAARVANEILNGDIFEVDSISGQVQPSTNASIFKFVANKVQE